MFKFITAIVGFEGELLIRYQLEGYPEAALAHDEDVAELTNDEIRDLVVTLIGAEGQKDIIEVEFD